MDTDVAYSLSALNIRLHGVSKPDPPNKRQEGAAWARYVTWKQASTVEPNPQYGHSWHPELVL